MIPAFMPSKFGPWLKAARLSTIDETTGRPMTQVRLAELLQVSGSKVAAWERDDIKSITPDDAHPLARILKRSVTEILQAIGFDVEETQLTEGEREMLAAYRRLREPGLQATALRVVRAMPAPTPVADPIRPQPRPRRQSA